MASIVRESTGRKRLSFKGPDGKYKAIRLGEMPEKLAQAFKDNIAHLVTCAETNRPDLVASRTVEWLAGLSDEMYERVARTGLVPSRAPSTKASYTVQQLCADVQSALGHAKPNTRRNYATIAAWLIEFFGGSREVANVKRKDADQLVAWLRKAKSDGGRGLGRATVARAIKAMRMYFKKAMEWEHTKANPFEGIRAGDSVNPARKHFVTMEAFQKIILSTEDREFRAVLALCRLGAMRCPSEIVALKWDDVIWNDEETGAPGKLIIRSTKTEAHAGGGVRELPLFPELAAMLQDHLGELTLKGGPQSEYVVSDRSVVKNWRSRLGRLIARSGLTQWSKLFHNLRASRESELYKSYPLDTVCRWLGHSPAIAAKHYLNDGDADANFRLAAGVSEASRQASRKGVKPRKMR